MDVKKKTPIFDVPSTGDIVLGVDVVLPALFFILFILGVG